MLLLDATAAQQAAETQRGVSEFMNGKHSIKLLAKRSAVLFPNLTNAIWKTIYLALIHKDKNIYSSETNQQQHNVVDTPARRRVFDDIFRDNAWENSESASGYGSTLYYTTIIRNELPKLLKRYNVRTFLDAPCGDFNWMRHVEIPHDVDYLGCDIVAGLIEDLSGRYSTSNRSFKVLDIVEGPIPRVDLWLCRDAIFHLTLDDGLRVLENAARSGTKFFASTTYNFVTENGDIPTGAFRFINLRKAPYNLPAPIEEIDDFLVPNPPRVLGLWSAEQLSRRFLSNARHRDGTSGD